MDWWPGLVSVRAFGLSALVRFDRDALALPGVTHIILLDGLNDIGFPGAKLENDTSLFLPIYALRMR